MVIVETGIELANCPFCGSEAHLKNDGWFNPKLNQNDPDTRYFWVKCSNPKCSVSPLSNKVREVAIENWNTRK